MVEFSDNNNVFSVTTLSSFYLNKGFHPHMSFSPDTTTYESTRERLQSVKVKGITTHMQELLNYSSQQLNKSWVTMKAQVDKHQKDVNYEVEDMV